ncbi:hypothetical protein BdWA1_003299 [Babesia duncani]|uniref:Uncharacterized protein n=1 Tax=Babesia duncani TaxID=323732 RepID=A0AAD9PJC0_9APIC|nr:hypothetical protein BdWA1_003299 [Babesia duncani]
MTVSGHDMATVRRFNMLGERIDRFERSLHTPKEPSTSSCDSDAGSCNENYTDGSIDSNENSTEIQTPTGSESDSIDKDTIAQLRDEQQSANNDHFQVEMMLKRRLYENEAEYQTKCAEAERQLQLREQELEALKLQMEAGAQFWSQRESELDALIERAHVNLQQVTQYKELCEIFDEKLDESQFE